MPVLASFSVDTTCGCCPGQPYLIVYDCESLTGTAVICGFSGFSSDSAPYDGGDPWAWEGQLRKWGSVSLSGELSSTSYVNTSCSGDAICYDPGPPGFADQQVVWTGSATLDCAGPRSDTPVNVTTTINTDCDTSNSTPSAYTITQNIPESSGFYSPTATLTARTWPGPGCILDTRPFVGRGSFNIQGSATETLGNEQFLYDALAALLAGGSEDVVAGDSCCAKTTSATLTLPQDQGSITIAGTGVRRPVFVGGCDVGTFINLIVTFFRVVDGVTEYLERTVAASCMALNYIHIPQPEPESPDWCWLSIVIA